MGLTPHAQADRGIRQAKSGLDNIPSNPEIPQHPVGAADLLALEPDDDAAFDRLARIVFLSQLSASPTYRVFADSTAGADWDGWRSVPFLPVEAFKWPGIVDFADTDAEAVFLSSATGGRRSRHPVLSTTFYDTVAAAWFEACVGGGPFWFVAHLPTYEAMGVESSLIHMVRVLMARFGTPESLFVPDPAELRARVSRSRGPGRGRRHAPLILFGTAFGMLEMIEDKPIRLPIDSLVVETGGMKSRRRDVDRVSLHRRLAAGFGLPRESIRSEYGMCEMLSQCYTLGGETFHSPPWVRVKVVDPDRPHLEVERGRPGLLAVFDLANGHSVSPILTEDLVREEAAGFEVLGRLGNADLRGCNFLFEQSV